MITKLATPGVYIDEISTIPPSVAEVDSAIPAFIGYTEKAIYGHNFPVKVTSLNDFEAIFGEGPNESEDKVAVNVDKITIGGAEQYNVTIDFSEADKSRNILWYAMNHFFDNQGATCFVVSVGDFKIPDKADFHSGILALADMDDPTMLLCPEASKLADSATSSLVMKEMIDQAASLKDRIAIVDVFDSQPDKLTKDLSIDDDLKSFRDSIGTDSDNGKYAAAYYPNLETTYSYNLDYDKVKIKNYKENGVAPAVNPVPDDTVLGTLKGSVVYNAVKVGLDKLNVVLPPSAAIAGIITDVDNKRGYWKAPANVMLNKVKTPTIVLSDRQQQALNIDTMSGKSVNVIRQFAGLGTVVWGARTLAGNDNEWRYINVRRFFMVVEESIKKSIQWAVFEPNTASTWIKVKGMIDNYLYQKWQQGALAGAKPDEAFFVKVGLGKTMTAQDVLEGRMNIEIGMAVARPAEFIILKFSQMLQTS